VANWPVRKRNASAASVPKYIGARSSRTRTSVKPALVNRSRVWSGSFRSPGDGAGGAGSRPVSAVTNAVLHGWCGCHDSSRSRPPGRVERARFVNAASGSPKNIAPWRLSTTSKCASGNGWTWASACSKDAFATARDRASAIIRDDRSTPSALPPAAWRAASRVVRPFPQPTSSTVAPGSMPAGNPYAATPSSYRSARSAQ
jgi:hypothetical protein